MLQDYEDWQAETQTTIPDIPGIQAKEYLTAEELRSLTLEALSVAYPFATWPRAYTDGSEEEAAKNRTIQKRAEVEFSWSSSIRKARATGQQSINYRAEACALLRAAQTLNQKERLLKTPCSSLAAGPSRRVSNHQEGIDLQQHQTGAVPA